MTVPSMSVLEACQLVSLSLMTFWVSLLGQPEGLDEHPLLALHQYRVLHLCSGVEKDSQQVGPQVLQHGGEPLLSVREEVVGCLA